MVLRHNNNFVPTSDFWKTTCSCSLYACEILFNVFIFTLLSLNGFAIVTTFVNTTLYFLGGWEEVILSCVQGSSWRQLEWWCLEYCAVPGMTLGPLGCSQLRQLWPMSTRNIQRNPKRGLGGTMTKFQEYFIVQYSYWICRVISKRCQIQPKDLKPFK